MSGPKSIDRQEVYIEWHDVSSYYVTFLKTCDEIVFTSLLIVLAQQPPVGQALLIQEVSRSHNDAPQSVGLLWTSE